MKLSVPSELIVVVENYYQEMGNPYFQLYSLSRYLDGTAPQQIISNVRNISLNLVLELENEFGIDINLEELLKNKPIANNIIHQQIMSQNIINTTGDANLINIGNENKISQEVKIEKNNFEELSQLLETKGVENSDIKELKEIINLDPIPSIENQTLNNKIQNWIANMTMKAANGTWQFGKQVGVVTAANLLSEAIMMYYGLG